MRIRDFAGRAGRSGVTARARDERSVPALVALLLRVVRQRGSCRRGAVRGPPAERARRPLRRRGREAASTRPPSPPVPQTRRRWAAVNSGFAGGSRPRAPRGPADAGCAEGPVCRSRARPGTSARVAPPRNSRGLAPSRVAGGRVAFDLGRARVRANVRRRAISRGTSDATALAWTHPSSGAVRVEGGHPRAGTKARGRGASQSPLSRIYRSPARAYLPAGGRTARRCATSVRRVPAPREAHRRRPARPRALARRRRRR
jgi:hypothetical protein